MNRVLSLLAAALWLVSTAMSAQTYTAPDVTVSSEKVKKDGSIYYSHVVLEKQTLFSISKAYNVSIQEICDANPGLSIRTEGLKKGSVILIPVSGSQVQQAPAAQTATPETGTEPEAKPAPAPVAVVPVASAPAAEKAPVAAPVVSTDETVTEAEPEFFYYTVKWYEDLSIVAKKHNTTKEVLMAFNGMASPKLTSRQQLKIPVHPELVDVEALNRSNATAQAGGASTAENLQAGIKAGVDSLQSKIESLATSFGEKVESIFNDNTPVNEVSVTMLLPLSNKDDVSGAHYDFYSGALLAVKDLAGEGISTDLDIRDIGKGLDITAGELSGSDLVIGPVSTKDIDSVLRVVGNGRNIISPLDPKALRAVDGHPGLIHAPSSADAQYQDIVKWIRRDMRIGDRLILITEEKGKVSDLARYVQESGMEYSSLNYGILMSGSIDSKLEAMMNQQATNRFVIASDSEAFVNDAVRNINLMVHRKYDVVLYAPSRIRNFDTIEAEHLHNANLHLSSSYYVDYEQTKIKHFLLSYRALFGTEPTPFSYQGYDTTYYILKAFSKSPARWTDDITLTRFKGLQSDFKFERKEGGGLYNTAVRRIIYHPDYSCTLTEDSFIESIVQ